MKVDQIIQDYVDDVALFLPRRIRNDIGLELKSLLIEQINAQAVEAGIEPNIELALDILQNYGRPEEVAEQYQPSEFLIIEPSAASSFVKIAVIGVILQWAISGVALYLAASSQGQSSLEKLGYWWFSNGLGALWWPGFLICCYGFAAWLKQRRPTSTQWEPRVQEMDHYHLNTVSMTALILGSFIGIAYLYVGPAWLLEYILPTGFNTSWAVYAEDFRSLWLPLFASLFVAQVFICTLVVMKGRWSINTRRSDLGLSMLWVVALVACGLKGDMLELSRSDEIARFALLVVAFFVSIDVFTKVRKEVLRVRMPVLNV